MLTKVVNENTDKRRLLPTWFFLYREQLLWSLGTLDVAEAEKRAAVWGRLCRAVIEREDDPFTDEDPSPHETGPQEETAC